MLVLVLLPVLMMSYSSWIASGELEEVLEPTWSSGSTSEGTELYVGAGLGGLYSSKSTSEGTLLAGLDYSD